jgi:hypothetical protein
MFHLSEKSFFQFENRELVTYLGIAIINVLNKYKGKLLAKAMQLNEQKLE